MFSTLDQDAVLTGLGDKFLAGMLKAVDNTRDDIDQVRSMLPGWFPTMAERTLANIIHDRIWAHLAEAFDSDPNISLLDREPRREIQVGTHFLLRIKRHHPADLISTYATRGALEFWAQNIVPTLPGLELMTLGAGYRWIKETRSIGPAVVSLRIGKDYPLWSVELTPPSEGVAGIRWAPIDIPDLPAIALHGEDEIGEEGDQSS